jgi:hypothetical protein
VKEGKKAVSITAGKIIVTTAVINECKIIAPYNDPKTCAYVHYVYSEVAGSGSCYEAGPRFTDKAVLSIGKNHFMPSGYRANILKLLTAS